MKKKWRISDENLFYIMTVWFMFALFGHNLGYLWETEEERAERKALEKARIMMYLSDEDERVGYEYGEDYEISEDEWKEWEEIEQAQADPVLEKQKRKVTVTQYNPVVEQCDEDPLVTADNSLIDLGKLERGTIRWVAVSRDLLGIYNYGDIIELTTKSGSHIDGRYVVHDTMNPRFTGRIDILTPVGSSMDIWHEVAVTKIKGGGS